MNELLQGTRQVVGRDSPQIIHLNDEELIDEYGGLTPDDCIQYRKLADGGTPRG